MEKLSDEFARVRNDAEALREFLAGVASSGASVWGVARPAPGARPLDGVERAMITEAVDAHLAGTTRWAVERRRNTIPPKKTKTRPKYSAA